MPLTWLSSWKRQVRIGLLQGERLTGAPRHYNRGKGG